ncbi:MAG: DUF933 domain-containing protein [Pseudomonadota bacterium]
MKLGLIGKRAGGKTLLFEAVSGLESVPQTGLVNVAKVRVKDPHIDKLSEIYKPKKTTYADFDVVDYNRAHDSSDATLGSANLVARYRELDAIVIVVGVIDDFSFISTELEDICVEMNISDTMILEAKIERMKKGSFDKNELHLYEGLLKKLENNEPVDRHSFSKDDMKYFSAFQLFALKPVMVAVNIMEDLLSSGAKVDLGKYKLPYILISAEVEKELNSLSEEEKNQYLKELGITEGITGRFVRMLYETMDLISFYTVGEDEVRAWSIPKNSTALIAAGKIHSDIERGFIKASTVSYDDFMKHGDEHKAKAAGVVRDEGKDYVVKNGDIIHFKFNV